jgi:exopolysaccharide biosynthesis polyprenyl glycosylphosphotransferase
MALDALILVGTGYLAYSISLEWKTQSLIMSWYDFLGCILFLMFSNNYFMAKFGFYSPRRFSSKWSAIWALFMAVSLNFIVLAAGVILVGVDPFSRVYLVVHFLSALTALIVARMILYYYLDRRGRTAFNSRQILLAGSKKRIAAVADALDRQRSWGHQVAGYLNVDDTGNPAESDIPNLGKLDNFDEVLRERHIDEVIFALPKGLRLDIDKYILTCKKTGVAFRIVPAMFDVKEARLRAETIEGIPTLTDAAGFASASGLMYKKMLDLLAGFLGFLIFLLLYPVVGLAIKLDSPGPVLFKQQRVGTHGRIFTLYKFRSMVANAESRKAELLEKSEVNGPIFKMERDPRITRVGRFLRKTSLDELPQFINVLKGEMSLVGTRPPTLDEVKDYEDWHRRRISIKPGITGLWQISGRSKITNFAEVVKLDLQYIERWRFWKDIVILWKTIWVVLARKGAL